MKHDPGLAPYSPSGYKFVKLRSTRNSAIMLSPQTTYEDVTGLLTQAIQTSSCDPSHKETGQFPATFRILVGAPGAKADTSIDVNKTNWAASKFFLFSDRPVEIHLLFAVLPAAETLEESFRLWEERERELREELKRELEKEKQRKKEMKRNSKSGGKCVLQ